VVDLEHAAALLHDIGVVQSSPWEGAKAHLLAAAEHMNHARHRDVIRESITAVESAVKDFVGDPSADLARALKKLQDNHAHPALRGAFDKLYAYTNDANGVRHAQVFGKDDIVEFGEAIFFFSACAAFIAYLKVKASVA